MARIKRWDNREVEPFEFDAYQYGRELAFRPRRTKRQSVIRREVRLDENGNPAALIEEETFTEENEY